MKLLTFLLSLLALASPLAAQDAPCCDEKPVVQEECDGCDSECEDMAQEATNPAQEKAMALMANVAESFANRLYSVNYEMSMNIEQMGQAMTMQMNSKILVGAKNKMYMTTDMVIEAAMMPEPMKMDMLTVMDGKTMYILQNNPMTGQMAMKLDLDNEELMGQVGGGMMPGLDSTADPVAQMWALAESITFTNFEETETSATLTAVPNDSFNATFAASGVEVNKIVMNFDKTTNFPSGLKMWMGDAEEAAAVITYGKPEFVEEFPEGTFVFKAPEGVEVQDLAVMMGAMSGAPTEGEEELDF